MKLNKDKDVMIRILTAFFLFALSILVFEGTLYEFQDSITISSAVAEASETVERANTNSIDEEILFPYSMYKDVLEGINFISEKTITTINNISNEILQPPR